MEMRTLRTFVEVVRQGGFSRAAKTVFVTQSTVSKAVKQLEDELGLQLLDRIGANVKLTAAGEIVYRRALAILAQGDDLKAELEELRGLKGGVLRLGVPLIGSNTLFAHRFAAYRNRYPGIELQLMEHGSKRLEELVLAGELDLAATLLPVGEEFEWQEVWREPIDVLLPAEHPLAASEKLSFRQLKDLPFILYGPGFALNQMILDACRESGFTPKVSAQSSQVDFVIELVATRLGVALLPRMIAEQRPHPLTRRVPVEQPALFWHLALIWRRGGYLSPAAQAWLALAAET
ncbi:LysR family transcriptional regulator [Geomonas silvestris]|uniref:LysR family transcriptional regulator n=1 Tax=Geomonas silvestris TaxID=2740184 RepID=A0A6V8MGK1_9BACT|nr:LysR family transcriptional regulator [Geomonas silvestris]GFO59116.1 LysR family transcriptional regulator [Geomonas silvestris]